ncbi:protein-lysine methyltransferase METTL21D-like [Triticum dicoccoides]|uniref:protein-lysine methyltransferase METTL21D-like n=1 Tax=Triticum dicoccoides TaxID=85692 RepID=UPI001891D51A|nr:protein-lysine methyltransferase METTL21D-like [Triticum dicoccoides]
MDYDRLNSPSTSAITLELMGHRLHISQDPNSKHLGTTVWDASMVFAKFLEKNSRKGRFCPSKLKGKRAIELGAGCGLAGLGMALLGCDVVTTDQVEVLPLLMRNVERNKSWIAQSNPDSGSFGSVTIAELDWGNKEHIRAVEPPFDYIIGTDVVYSEHLLQPLLETIIALSGPKTKVLLGYEIRSTTVHEQMMEMWKINFNVKTISKSKMDAKYQHPSINLYMMDLKASSVPEAGPNGNGNTEEEEEEEDDASNPGEDEDPGVKTEPCTASKEDMDDWEIRRSGAMAARLLKDVRLT